MSDLSRSKTLHQSLMACLLSSQGIGGASEDDYQKVQKATLNELLEAKSFAEAANADTDVSDGEKRIYIVPSEMMIAELYLRLHDSQFYTAKDLINTCINLDMLNPDTLNGHGILLDGHGNVSLLELNRGGDGAYQTLCHARSVDGMMGEANSYAEKYTEE